MANTLLIQIFGAKRQENVFKQNLFDQEKSKKGVLTYKAFEKI